MLPSNLEVLNNIIDEISFIEHTVLNKNRDKVINDSVLSRAIIRSLVKLALKLILISNRNIQILNGEKCQTQEIV